MHVCRLLVIAVVACTAFAAQANAQKLVPTPPSGDLEQVYKWIWFAPNGIGYVASQHALLRTSDHGDTWMPLRETIKEAIPGIRDILFLTESTFFVDGWRGIWRTTDGGITFQGIPQRVPRIDDARSSEEIGEGFFFLDADHGWGLGGRQFVITADGGKNWMQRRFRKREFGFEQPGTLWLFDTRHAIGVGARHVFRTEDEGVHWAAVPNSPQLDQVQCTLSGFCAGRRLRREEMLHVSSDAGQAWQAVSTGLDPDRDEIAAFQVIANNDIVLVGTHNDQGRSERLAHGARAVKPTAAPFKGLLLRWNGSTWQRHEYAALTRLRAVHFVNATEAWAAADFNGILHSTDGGETWAFVPDYYRQPNARTPAPTPAWAATPAP